jgi:hypothetical protein
LASRYRETLADLPNERSNKIKAVHKSRAIMDAQLFQWVTLWTQSASWRSKAKISVRSIPCCDWVPRMGGGWWRHPNYRAALAADNCHHDLTVGETLMR